MLDVFGFRTEYSSKPLDGFYGFGFPRGVMVNKNHCAVF
jgi:hypothetical protein